MTVALYAAKAASATTSSLYTLDSGTAAPSSIGATGHALTALAFRPSDGALFAVSSPGSTSLPNHLFILDPLTGAVLTDVGALGMVVSDIAFSSTNGLYGWAPSTEVAVTINTSTGAAASLGAGATTSHGGALSFHSDGSLYLLLNVGGGLNLYTVNTGSGLVSLVGAVSPFSGNIPAAASFDSSDLLWWLNGGSGGSGINLQTLNIGTIGRATIGAPGADFDALAWSLPAAATVGRVLIALDDTALEENPTWTRIDDTPNLVSGIDIRRGKQSETDETETSTATVYLNDTTGDFDMHNTLSTYWGKLVGHQILLQIRNPVTDVWESQTRMVIDDLTHDFNPATNAAGKPLIANVALECVDQFDYLAGVEMIPGLFGDAPPAGSERTVFYEDTTGGDGMQTRLVQLATDAGVPAGRTRFFTGNVDLQETKYDPGESLLVAMRDAVDAEFPDIANLYTDRRGILAAHGRFARFTPAAVASGTDWDFTTWKAGDGAAILLDSDRAQIRPPLGWDRPRSRIVNAAMCTPKGIVDADVPGQIVADTSSITAYGYRSWSALDLIVKVGATTGFTANGECRSFAKFKVDNLKDPHTRVEAITFKSLRPDDPRGPKTWDLLCRVDISDVIELTHGYPGPDGVGMSDEPFYVEGMETQIRPLNPDYDWVEKTVNVSPASSYPPGYVFSDA